MRRTVYPVDRMARVANETNCQFLQLEEYPNERLTQGNSIAIARGQDYRKAPESRRHPREPHRDDLVTRVLKRFSEFFHIARFELVQLSLPYQQGRALGNIREDPLSASCRYHDKISTEHELRESSQNLTDKI
jgi:hypothetical protein